MKKLYTALVLTVFVLPLVAQNIPSYVPKDGLVGYWPFNGNANDESGNGNNGTVNGATLTADRNGVANSAYSFNGNQWIEVNNNFNHNVGAGSFTLSCWSLKSGNNDFDHLITRNQATSNKDFISSYNLRYQFGTIAVAGSSSALENLYNGGCATVKVNDLNKWNYTVAVFDSLLSTYSIYINGELNTKCKITNKIYSINNNGKIYFGVENPTANLESGPLFINGYIDDIAIYKHALSEQEIKQLYEGCTKETATSSNFNTLIYTNNAPVNLTATPTGGSFRGNGIANNAFNPSKAKLGKNTIKYNFKNTTGCADSTDFAMLVVDTVGATCTKFDTVKVNKYDTVKVTKFDTITVKNNVFDTVKVTKYDTLTVTNNVTKYDTVIINKTKYDTVIVKTNVFDTVKVTKYDTLTVKNNIYDTVKVTKFDTITNNVTKYDTVIVNKTNYDTVSILKIKFKLTTGIHANQLSSLSIYPNPTSDVLHIEVPDAKALEGYRYRILDALGKEVYNQLVTQSATEIPLKTLGAAGVYQFEILDAKNASIQSNKIVLQ